MTKLLKDIHRHTLCRSLMSVAAYSVLLFTAISCAQDMPSTPEQEQIPISMSASAVESIASSRALITNNNLQGVHLGVYATKTVASSNSPILVFNNVELEYKNSVWDYSPKRYWDRTASYNFVAYAPYSVSVSASTSYAPSTNTLTIEDIPYWQTINGSETDYLVANSNGTAESYLNNPTSTAVPLSFSHILSQFVVKIVKDAALSDVEYKLMKVEYINVPVPAEGSTATYNYTSGAGSMGTISLNDETAPLSKLNDTNGKDVTLANATSGKITLSHLVVPFSGNNNIKIKVTYTIEGTERSKTVDTKISSLNAGKYNELTLTFMGTNIVPSVEIKNWTDVSVDEDPKYNW